MIALPAFVKSSPGTSPLGHLAGSVTTSLRMAFSAMRFSSAANVRSSIGSAAALALKIANAVTSAFAFISATLSSSNAPR